MRPGLLLNLSTGFLTAALTTIAAAAPDSGGDANEFPVSINALKEAANTRKAPAVSSAAAVPNGLADFWTKLNMDAYDDVCKNAALELNKGGKLAAVAGLEGGFKRYMRKLPDGKVALIDEVKVNLSASLGNAPLRLPDVQGLSVSLAGLLEGKSQVLRALESDRYCKELGTLARLYRVKTVLPASAGRISRMKNGEIWKLPLTLRMSFGSAIGTTINEVLKVSLSAGITRESKPSVTLYRMDDKNLRLRLRLDRIEVKSVGVSASSVEIPMADIGLWKAENILADLVNKAWAKKINEYIALKLSYEHSRFSGKKLLLEFILDPANPIQMEGLEKLLRGDLGAVRRYVEMGLNFNSFSDDDDCAGGLGKLEDLAGQAGQALDSAASFAGSDIYSGRSNNLNIQVPVLHTQNTGWSSSYNRYQSLAREGEALHVQQRTAVSEGSSLNIPFAGAVVKYGSRKDIYVINKEGANGRTTGPAMMYQQHEGFIRQGDGAARNMIEKANGVLRYVGANGEGTDQSNTVPADGIFPPLPEDPDGGPNGPGAKTYKSAVMSFKLLVSDRGVQDILSAPADAIMKAYINMMRETEGRIISMVMDLFTTSKDGKVDYDRQLAGKRLGISPLDHFENAMNPLDIVDTLAYAATQVIRDITSVREAGGWKERSGKLAKVSAGNSRSGLGYEDFLKVVVQLVKPGNISAEVYVHTDKRVTGEADVTRNYMFFNNRDNDFDSTIAEVNQARERFAEPSELTD